MDRFYKQNNRISFDKRSHWLLTVVMLTSFCSSSLSQKKILPDFVGTQLSGSLGEYSVGLGYYAFKTKTRVSGHYGFVPQRSGSALHVASIKFFFRPITMTVWNRVKWSPVDFGVIASYVAGKTSLETPPDEVSKIKSAWWRHGLDARVALENVVTYEFKEGQRFKSVSGYLEVNTNEPHFLNFIRDTRNSSLWEILKFGTGVRLTF